MVAMLATLLGCSGGGGTKTGKGGSGGSAGQGGSGGGGAAGATGGSGGSGGSAAGGASGEAGADASVTDGPADQAMDSANDFGSSDSAIDGGHADVIDSGQPGLDGATDGGSHVLVKQVVGGGAFSCALTATGGVKCWGANGLGTVGNGAPVINVSTKVLVATDVVGLTSGVKRIAAAASDACAIKDNGDVVCWGANTFVEGSGQLVTADPSAKGSSTPVPLTGFSGKAIDVAVTGGDGANSMNGCVVDTGSKVWCWGNNSSEQLGVSGIHVSASVVSSADLSGFASVAPGGSGPLTAYTCGLTPAGGVKCWGSNAAGHLGIGNDDGGLRVTTTVPVEPVGLGSGIAQLVASGQGTTCVLTTTSGVKCWGDNSFGQAGIGADSGFVVTPTDVLGLGAGVSQIAAGYMHLCALLTADGTIKCWGYDQNGQIGDQPASLPINLHEPTPTLVKDVRGAVAIGLGSAHTCAALATGGVVCWGTGEPSGSSLPNQIHPTFVTGL
jgi:alpha-tubulin suppressor-like RCC1 family protein